FPARTASSSPTRTGIASRSFSGCDLIARKRTRADPVNELQNLVREHKKPVRGAARWLPASPVGPPPQILTGRHLALGGWLCPASETVYLGLEETKKQRSLEPEFAGT